MTPYYADGGVMSGDIWTWLRGCKSCGRPHDYQPSGYNRIAGTWADPTDGHPYWPRLNRSRVDELQAAYEDEQAQP